MSTELDALFDVDFPAGIARHRSVVFAAALREALAPWDPNPSNTNPPCNSGSDDLSCRMKCTCNDAPIEPRRR